MNNDIIYIDSYDFDRRIEHGVTAVLFFSEWCVHSRGLMPILEEVADLYYDSIRIMALDIEQSPDVASVFAVDQTPTVLFFIDGKLACRLAGANPASVYAEVIEELLVK